MHSLSSLQCAYVHVRVCVRACVSVAAEAALLHVPQNSAVIEGSDVTLNCRSNVATAVIKWFSRLCPSYDVSVNIECLRNSVVYNGYTDDHNPPRFSVTSSQENDTIVTRDLNINKAQLTDAGVYVCVEQTMVLQTSSAQLIIIGKHYCCTGIYLNGNRKH